MNNKEQIDEIKKTLETLKKKCYYAKCPFVAVVQYRTDDSKEHRLKTILSPEAVKYEGDTKVFYEVTNVLNGEFKTVLAKEYPDDSEEDEDKFFG